MKPKIWDKIEVIWKDASKNHGDLTLEEYRNYIKFEWWVSDLGYYLRDYNGELIIAETVQLIRENNDLTVAKISGLKKIPKVLIKQVNLLKSKKNNLTIGYEEGWRRK